MFYLGDGRVSFFQRRTRSAFTTRQHLMNSPKNIGYKFMKAPREMPQSKKGNMGGNIAEAVEGGDLPAYPASLPVPNVQEMVRKNPTQVPERYIRNQEDKPNTADITRPPCDIPVIDVSLLSNGHKEELKRLELACREWGFFQVVNHGVAEEVVRGMKNCASEFFERPLEEKKKYATTPHDIQGYGQVYVVSEEQKLDWADVLGLIIYPPRFRNLKFWPKECIEGIEAYTSEARRVAKEVLCALCLIMGADKDTLLGPHKDVAQVFRVNYYPTCSKPDQVLGLSPHSDSSIVTVLMQDNDVTGLHIKHNGEWMPVKLTPDALVVNIGDVIEIWSNGKFKSIEHRAVTNENSTRISVASFVAPHDDVEIEPLDHFVDSEQPVKLYKKVRYGDYLRHSLARKMEGKVHTEMAKNEN